MNQDNTKDSAHEGGCCGADETPMKSKSGSYTCPMHPNVKKNEPGSCPDCGMNLVPAENLKS